MEKSFEHTQQYVTKIFTAMSVYQLSVIQGFTEQPEPHTI